MKSISYEKKLVDWESAFNSMNRSQVEDAEILAGLIQGLKDSMIARDANKISGVAA